MKRKSYRWLAILGVILAIGFPVLVDSDLRGAIFYACAAGMCFLLYSILKNRNTPKE